MKACPNAAIFKFQTARTFTLTPRRVTSPTAGGVFPRITLVHQELPADFAARVDMIVNMNACSVSQLERFDKVHAGTGQKVFVSTSGVDREDFSTVPPVSARTNAGPKSFGIVMSSLKTEIPHYDK
jgi:hypothetical protein